MAGYNKVHPKKREVHIADSEQEYIGTNPETYNQAFVYLPVTRFAASHLYLTELGFSPTNIDKILEWACRVLEARGE